DTFTLQTLQQFTPSLPTQLIYYCPHSNYFSLITDLHMTSSHQALVHMAFKQADSTRFSELFSSATFPIKQLYKNWVYEKTSLRFRRMKLIGSEAVFWNWLYQKGVHLQQIPGIIYLPNPSQHRMRIPLWQWQSR